MASKPPACASPTRPPPCAVRVACRRAVDGSSRSSVRCGSGARRGWLCGAVAYLRRVLHFRRDPNEPVLEEVEGEPGGQYSLVRRATTHGATGVSQHPRSFFLSLSALQKAPLSALLSGIGLNRRG